MNPQEQVCQHRSFTEIELFVVLGILAIPICLLQTKVQIECDAAVRAHSQNYSKIPLSCRSFHHANRLFPSEWLTAIPSNPAVKYIASVVPILPYICRDNVRWNWYLNLEAPAQNNRDRAVRKRTATNEMWPYSSLAGGPKFAWRTRLSEINDRVTDSLAATPPARGRPAYFKR